LIRDYPRYPQGRIEWKDFGNAAVGGLRAAATFRRAKLASTRGSFSSFARRRPRSGLEGGANLAAAVNNPETIAKHLPYVKMGEDD
jgi:hypothetical protein